MEPELPSSSSPLPTKRNEFFVDTKTTCFLCLHEIPTVINLVENDEDENKVNDKIGQVEGNIFCMRVIFRYLKMNPGILFKTQLTGSLLDSAKLLNKIADWKVLLCRECTPFAKRLSDLCCQMEMVQMKVDHSLQLFQTIIDNSEKDSEKVEKFRGKLTEPLDTLQLTIADLLRNETREKCNGFLKTAIPRVNLTKCEKFFTFVGTKETPFPPTNYTTRPPPPPPVSLFQQPPPPPPVSVPIPILKNLLNPASFRCKICGFSFASKSGFEGHMSRRHPSSELISVKVNHKCHLCTVVCSSAKSLRRHITNRHHIQTSVMFHTCNGCGLKLPSKPEWIKHTRLYCEHRRTNTTLQGRIAIKLEKPPPPPPPVQVPTPQLPPPPPPIRIHTPPLPPPAPVSIKPVSVTPVKTVNLSELMNPMPHFRTGNNEFLCSLCPVRNSNDIFRTEDQLRTHLFVDHADYFFSPLKLPEVSKEQFQTYCYQIIQNDMKVTTQQNTGFHQQGRGPLTYTCVHCSGVFSETRSKAMNAHMIQSHYALLVPKLMDLQRGVITPTPVSTPLPPPIPVPQAPPPPPINSPLKNQWVPVRQLKCSSCSAIFSQSSSLSRHRRLNCPGLFAISKAAQLGHRVNSGLTGRGNVGRFQCADCGAWFLRKLGLYRHRKREHSKNATPSLPPPTSPAPPTNLPKPVAGAPELSDFPFVCDYCENRFASYQGKKAHMKDRCYKRRNHFHKKSLESNINSPQTYGNDEEGEPSSSLGPMVTSTFSLSSTTSATPTPGQNSWPCQNCGSSFTSSSALYSHQRQHCLGTVGDGGSSLSHELNESSGVSVGVENYYDEEQAMVEQEEEEVYPGSYVNTKIEVLAFQQVQIFPNNHESRDEIEEVEEMNSLYQGSMMVNEDGDEELIYEGEGSSMDPLC